MNPPPPLYQTPVGTPGLFVIICAACQERDPREFSRALRLEETLDLVPTDTCQICGEPLLESGKVKKALEALGFAFVTHGAWSAWMRSGPLGHHLGATNPAEIEPVSAIDFITSRTDWHAPLDDEDGQVVLKRCRTWPLVQPENVARGGKPFHWVQEHEAHPALSITALIRWLQDGVL